MLFVQCGGGDATCWSLQKVCPPQSHPRTFLMTWQWGLSHYFQSKAFFFSRGWIKCHFFGLVTARQIVRWIDRYFCPLDRSTLLRRGDQSLKLGEEAAERQAASSVAFSWCTDPQNELQLWGPGAAGQLINSISLTCCTDRSLWQGWGVVVLFLYF